MRGLSSACHDERRGKVAVDDKSGESVVLAYLVLVRVDLLSQNLVKVDLRLLLLRRLGAHQLSVQHVLEVVLEFHDHVETVSAEDLEDKHVGPVARVANCDAAAKDAVILQVSVIHDFFDRNFLISHVSAGCRLDSFHENLVAVDFLSRRLLVGLKEEKLELFFVVLEAADQVQALLGTHSLKHLCEFDVISGGVESSVELDRLGDKFLSQLDNVRGEPAIQREGSHVF